MPIPTISSIGPVTGSTGGGDLVRLAGQDFSARVEVWFGTAFGDEVQSGEADGVGFVDVLTPPHLPATVEVRVLNLDENGVAVPGEEFGLADAYTYRRPSLVTESDLTRLARTLLQNLKRAVLENTGIAVSVDYVEDAGDQLQVLPVAKAPSMSLSGPDIRHNALHSAGGHLQTSVGGVAELYGSRRSVDLTFGLTVLSDRTAELLNLQTAVARFQHRHRYIEMLRDPAQPELGSVRWQMFPDGEIQSGRRGADGLQAFSAGLVIRGFDIDEGRPRERVYPAEDYEVHTTGLVAQQGDEQ